MSYCFGIDIGGTTVKCGLFTTEGVLLEKWEIKTRTEENGKAILPDVAETILKKMEEKGIEKTEVTGVGVGVPGPVVKEREVQVAVNLHWGYTMLADDLEKLLDQIPVKVGNDANVAALGEMWKGGGEGTKNLIMATLGTGVGGGIIVLARLLPEHMVQVEKSDMPVWNRKKPKAVTVEIKAVWNRWLLLPVS